jgi:hypothetical protein
MLAFWNAEKLSDALTPKEQEDFAIMLDRMTDLDATFDPALKVRVYFCYFFL